MRPASAHLTAHLAAFGLTRHTRARCVWMRLRDGTVMGFTVHDRALTVDMLDISDVPVVFNAGGGVSPSAIELNEGFSPSNCEISGPVTAQITAVAVMGGRFNGARVRVFDVDWKQAIPDVLPLLAGNVREARLEERKWVFEVRSDTDRANQSIGEVLTPYCQADLGDERCKFPLVGVPVTIAAVTDRKRFTVTGAEAFADDYFNLGHILFTSGTMLATDTMEVFDWTQSSGAIELYVNLVDTPLVGDTLLIHQGCDKLRPTCVLTFNNILNFRGHPDVPGSDQVFKVAVPGHGEPVEAPTPITGP